MSQQSRTRSSGNEDAAARGQTLRERRRELGWSLDDLAGRAQVSKAYISAIERGRSRRLGAEVLRRLEAALGLSEERAADDIPQGLAQVVKEHRMSRSEAIVLSRLRVRGRQPQSKERWDFIYKALLTSETLDHRSGHRESS
jgi:transcriptional regulator with XRE-family HTH domain